MDGAAPETAREGADPEPARERAGPETAVDGAAPEIAMDGAAPEIAMDEVGPEIAMDGAGPDAVDPAGPEAAKKGARVPTSGAADSEAPWRPRMLLEPATGHRWLVPPPDPQGRFVKVPGLGVLDPLAYQGRPIGERLQVAGKDLVVLEATPADYHATLRRKAQIITAKDTARIVHELGLRHGMRVFESGIGSGAATLQLLSAVAPGGRVVVQELREDFAAWARSNVAAAGDGLDSALEVHVGDARQGLADGVAGPFDAVLLDLPEPWTVLPHCLPHLVPGARIACYTPQVSQMERTVHFLRSVDAADIRAFETIEREWEVKEFGSRPGFSSLGHTAFLVFARWLGD